MRIALSALVVVAAGAFFQGEAQAASCSSFAVVKSYDAAKETVEVSYEKGRMKSYFPKPEGTPTDSTKIPKECRSKVKRHKSLAVKAEGGMMSITQVRSNLDGNILNEKKDGSYDPKWFEAKMGELIKSKAEIVIIVREMGPGKDAPLGITTVYLPITDAEKAEIKRREDQAEDV